MAHLLHKYHSSALFLGIGMLMLFSFCAPAYASDAPANPTFRSTSPFGINQTIKDPATVNINGIHQGTIYKPFSSDHPYADLNPGNGSGGSSDPNDDIGIPGWADTPSEPLPIGDGMGILLLMATIMVGAIFLKQRKQLSESISKSTTSTTNINNLRGNQLPTALKKENNTTQHMTTRKQTYQSFFQKLFLLLAFVCVAGQVSAKIIYFRPSTITINNDGYNWCKMKSKAWFAMLRTSNYANHTDYQWHVLNEGTPTSDDYYASKYIYQEARGKQSRFLGFTIDDENDGFAFYRINDDGNGNYYTAYYFDPTKAKPGDAIYNCIPNNDWWVRTGNSDTWYGRMFCCGENLGGYDDGWNLIGVSEGQWGGNGWNGYYLGYYVVNDVHLYFANTNNWTTPMFARGKDVYSYKDEATNIPNTKLYYTKLAGSEDIAYRNYAYFDDATGTWNELETLWKDYQFPASGSLKYTTQTEVNKNIFATRLSGFTIKSQTFDGIRLDYNDGYKKNASYQTSYLFQPKGPTNNDVNQTKINNYTDLNYTLTVKTYSAVKHNANTSPTYNDDNNNTNGGTIEYSAYKLSGQGTSVLTEGSSSTASTDITAAYTGTIVLTAVPKTGYKFVGWYSSTGDLLSTDIKWTTEKTKGNTTIQARFMSYNKQIRMQTYGWYQDPKDKIYKNMWREVADGGQKITITYNDGTGNITNEKTTAATLDIYPQEGTTVQLSAVAKDNYTFVGWWNNNGQRYDNNPWSFKPEETNQSITARFAPSRQQTINVQTYDTNQDKYIVSGNGGSVSIDYTKLTADVSDGYTTTSESVSSTETFTALQNTGITLKATPNTNYAFLGWYEGENKVSTEATYTYTATTDRNITARFYKEFTQNFIVQTEIGGQYQNSTTGGTATITYNDGTITKNIGSSKLSITDMYQGSMNTLTATPNDGYRFVGWFQNDGTCWTENPYTYRAEGARTLHARFARNDVQLVVAVMNYNTDYADFVEYPHDNNTVTIANGGNTTTVTSSTSAIVNYGSQVTLTANNDERDDGYDFIGWYQNNQRISTNPTYTFTITDHSAISAHFAPKQCHKVILYHTFGGQYQVKYARPELFDSKNGYYVANSLYNKDTTIFVPYEAKLTIIASTAKPTIGYEYTGYYRISKVTDAPVDGVYTIKPTKTAGGEENTPEVFVEFIRTEDQIVYLDLTAPNAREDWKNRTQYFINVRNIARLAQAGGVTAANIELTKVKDGLYSGTIPGNTYTDVTFYYEEREGEFKRISTTPQVIPATRNNCFILNGVYSSTDGWIDGWTTLDTENGDYRLIYREQTVVDKNNIRVDYEFNEGDRIKKITSGTKTDIVSLHIYNKVSGNVNGVNNPEVILQQWSDNEDDWVDVERYMVFGPLRSDKPGVIKMPNRKNTASETIVVDKGIAPIIAATNEEDQACGVWNFYIKQENGSAKLEVGKTEKYTGNYYIRTTNADGQYNNFTHPNNVMTYSEYAKKNSDFSHYFVRYVDIYEDGTPTATAGKHPVVKFTIANDHAMFLCKEFLIDNNRFTDDEYGNDIFVLDKDGAPNLPVDATVRFGWDIVTNRLTRAYIADTEFKNNEYLIVEGDKIGDVSGEKAYFDEIGDHFYQIDLSAEVPSDIKVKAKMNGNYQYFMGSENATGQLIGGQAKGSYPVRLLYDFKNDRFITICELTGTINGNINLETSVMIVREHNDAPKQLTFANNDASITATPNVPNTGEDQYTKPAYAVMTFLEDKLLDNNVSKYEKMFYWISFPFDVKISDVFGLGEYGKYWIMEEYDGKQRSENGLAQTNWKYITKKSHILKQNVGYVLCLNYNQILQDQLFTSHGAGEFGHSKLSLYFPSNSVISPAMLKGGQTVTRTLERMENNATAWNHHNWHLIGVPSFANPGTIDEQQDAPFVYQYWHPGDAYAAVSINDVKFQAMHAYMVQYAGKIKWTNKIVNTGGNVSGGKSLAAKTDEEADEKIMLRLELQQAGSTLDKTYVQLRNDKGTKGFDMSLDLTKIINAGANIYSIVDNHEMAGNAIPKDETVLPLGVVITAAGEYTFAMPNGTEGMIVELIDYEQGTSTNLLMSDYTITLDKGTFNQRFALRLKPDKVATSVEDITGDSNDDNVRKLLIDGVLYLVKDGAVYDAQGKHVQ